MSLIIQLQKEENFTLIKLSGKILSEGDLTNANAILSDIKNWNVVFDLSELSHTNSSGMAFLVKTMTRARIQNGDVVLLNPAITLKKLFEITKMHEVFPIYDTLDAATNHFSK